ncbi:MAG: stalk domain-containing protein [Syntrophomonadaceae bacterium]|nr:stalk domain-containing protein [Syntrophomonadaceae bacterium]
MKGKYFILILALTAVLFLFPASSFAAENQVVFTIGSSNYFVNDQANKMAAEPFIENGRSFVPVRFLALALGVSEENIKWLSAEQKVVLTKDGKVISLTIGSLVLDNSGTKFDMDVAPVIRNGYTYLPARYAAEALGYQVGWDQNSRSVLVGPPGNLPKSKIVVLEGKYTISTKNYTEDNEKVGTDIKYPVFTNMDDKGIENKVNEIIRERIDSYKTFYHQDDETYKESIFVTYEITKKAEDVVSLYFVISLYTEGAAHPNNLMDGVTVDLKTGKELELKGLFKEDLNYKQILNQILHQKIEELDYELFDEFKGIEEEQGFYMTDSGLVIYYQEYVYTPHAVGPLRLEISHDEIIAYVAV